MWKIANMIKYIFISTKNVKQWSSFLKTGPKPHQIFYFNHFSVLSPLKLLQFETFVQYLYVNHLFYYLVLFNIVPSLIYWIHLWILIWVDQGDTFMLIFCFYLRCLYLKAILKLIFFLKAEISAYAFPPIFVLI